MLIIAEKPSVARKIASFLSNSFRVLSKFPPLLYFKLNNEKVYVTSALGHLFTLSDLRKDLRYPSFDYKWIPAYIEDKIYAKKKFIEILKKFKNEKKIIIATDYDIEGELIGYNILRFIFNKNSAYRMVFSAITKKDILNAFYNLKEVNLSFALAGETRHIIDWIYGINLSRALTKAIRHYIKKVVLSIGRVQGPTLKLIYEREKEIENFKPEPYYLLFFQTKVKFMYPNIIKDYKKALELKNKCGNYLKIEKVIKKKIILNPPYPYNLSDLQQEAWKLYRISPKKTLDIAQNLYESGLISYPRTESQKLPSTINFREILENLSRISLYKEYIKVVLKKEKLIPNNGTKDDVHPAIHPTGEIPKNLSRKEFLIYDLIVRKFIATFLNPSYYYHIKVLAKSNEIPFIYEYKFKDELLESEWIRVYWKIYSKEFESVLFREGEILRGYPKIEKRYTEPPPRYSPASLVKKLEELELGTKATRPQIIHILYKRKYIKGRKAIKITTLGRIVVEILEQYIPEIFSVELTRKLEKNLHLIEKGKIYLKEETIKESKEIVLQVCSEIKEKEKEIGYKLYQKYKELRR